MSLDVVDFAKTIFVGFSLAITVIGAWFVTLGSSTFILDIISEEWQLLIVGLVLIIPGSFFVGKAVQSTISISTNVEGELMIPDVIIHPKSPEQKLTEAKSRIRVLEKQLNLKGGKNQ